MKKLLPLIFLSLTACNSQKLDCDNITLPQIASIAEKELNFKSYRIIEAPLTQVRYLCRNANSIAIGCTTSQVSMIDENLAGDARFEIAMHELMHQYQFIEQIATGRPVVSEAPAYTFGARMNFKYCGIV